MPILAIGLSLYESLPDLDDGTGTAQAEQLGKEVVRTQWLDHSTLGNHPLRGKKILIVDEVDDSRTTLDYAIRELKKDVEDQLAALSEAERAQVPKTEFGIFVGAFCVLLPSCSDERGLRVMMMMNCSLCLSAQQAERKGRRSARGCEGERERAADGWILVLLAGSSCWKHSTGQARTSGTTGFAIRASHPLLKI